MSQGWNNFYKTTHKLTMYWNMEEPISPLLTPLPLPWQTWPHILRKIHVSLSGKLITRYLSWQTRFFLALGGAHYFSHCLTFRFEGDSSQKPKGRSSIARPPADSRHCLSCSVSLSLHSSFLEITIFHSPHSIVSNISFPPPPPPQVFRWASLFARPGFSTYRRFSEV